MWQKTEPFALPAELWAPITDPVAYQTNYRPIIWIFNFSAVLPTSFLKQVQTLGTCISNRMADLKANVIIHHSFPFVKPFF